MNVAINTKEMHYPLLQALSPLQKFLDDENIIEISVNAPGYVFIERLGSIYMERHDVPELDGAAIRLLSERVATTTKQFINQQHPLLGAALPLRSERIQFVISPACEGEGIFSIRKQVMKNMTLDDYEKTGAFDKICLSSSGSSEIDERLSHLLKQEKYGEFLRTAIAGHVTMLISGGTGTGKTTFMNACLHAVDLNERIITIEDARELHPPHQNIVHLVASKGGQGRASVSIQDLLEASLRLRPDRIFLGEVRGSEVVSFLQAVNTGHPGSMCTVHADNPTSAYERIAMMMMQSGAAPTLTRDDLIRYIKSAIPIVIQLTRNGGHRGLSEIYFARSDDHGI
ncbi:P-type DNA transfer ATPase VirB11 [Allorhizobium sp. BGMRC 0089]|uniref:P-type DNA transfer ATPase VirB11 n=1 Tax=Allorhizobium sonneratiae TaxID=2934936 RepID=UPI0020336FE6|nr:P-type DNA transfer ATPase VirB11 [Allorhizobium sonneratiae]MCM2294712.1 P-type DNA transfer ATPase VirB11 [Allorhizobium sonneratiae]